MKLKYLVIGIIVLLIVGCGEKSSITEIDYSTLKGLINDKQTFILEVIQTGCSHCEEFSPRLKKILKDNKITAYSINLYNLTSKEEKEFNKLTTSVTGTPTVLFFKDGKETSNRIYGAVSDEKIVEHLKKGGYIK